MSNSNKHREKNNCIPVFFFCFKFRNQSTAFICFNITFYSILISFHLLTDNIENPHQTFNLKKHYFDLFQ